MLMKGSMLDLPIILGLLLGGALTIFIVYFVLDAINTAWPMADVSKTIIQTGVNSFSQFDYMFLFFAVGLCMFSVVSAFFVNSHPVFFIFSMILLGIIVMVSAMVTNVFYEFATTSQFSSVALSFPFITTFMLYLPVICLVVGLLIAVVLHAKPPGGARL